MRALIVDDSIADRDCVISILSAMGVESEWLDKMPELKLSTDDFDVVFLGIMDGDGVQPVFADYFSGSRESLLIIVTGHPQFADQLPSNVVVVDKGEMATGIQSAIRGLVN